jgi:flagellar motor switch protein FliM
MQVATEPQTRRRPLAEALAGGSGGTELLAGIAAVFDRVPDLLVERLAPLMHLKPSASLSGVETGRAVELVRPDAFGVCGPVHAAAWGGRFLFLADADAASAFVEAALGSDGAQPPRRPARPATRVERAVTQILFHALADALAAAFAPIEIAFEVEDVPEGFDAKLVGPPATSVIAARLALGFGDRGGSITILLPQALLRSVRDVLARRAPPPERIIDAEWTRDLERQIAQSFVVVSAVLAEHRLRLSELASLRPGMVLELDVASPSRVRLECGGNPLYRGQVGKANGTLVVRIEGSEGNAMEARSTEAVV